MLVNRPLDDETQQLVEFEGVEVPTDQHGKVLPQWVQPARALAVT